MDKVDKSLLGADLAAAREQLRESLAEMGGLRTDSITISARWAAGIACVEVSHFPPDSSKRKYLRLRLDEARRLRDELDAVIAEREPDA